MYQHMHVATRFFLIACLSLGFISCATTAARDFEKVKVGMHKDDLLDLMGSPARSEFRDDRYFYTYRFLDSDSETLREVVIEKDRVIYVGDILPLKARLSFKLQKGNTKSQTMDLLGFPAKTKKDGEKERWSYVFVGESRKFSQEFVFESDKIVEVHRFASYSEEPAAEAPGATPAGSPNFEPVE